MRYIDEAVAIKNIKDYTASIHNIELDYPETYEGDKEKEIKAHMMIAAIELIEAAQTADVEPVVHAEWIDLLDEIACSECGKTWNLDDNDAHTFKHCPNCGAKMGGKDGLTSCD